MLLFVLGVKWNRSKGKQKLKPVAEQLQDLIAKSLYDSSSLERQKALNRLLIAIAFLPGIYKSNHQDYPEAYNRTLEWVSRNLHNFTFEPDSPSIEKSFVTWINGYLKWRIIDLYSSDKNYQSINIHLTKDDDRNDQPLEQFPDPKFSLNLLELKIAQLQEAQRQRQGQTIRDYIEQDPEQKLSKCYPRKCPDCNCQLLTIRLIIQEPAEKIADLAREFNINNQTLYSHWKQKCLPLLREIGQKFQG